MYRFPMGKCEIGEEMSAWCWFLNGNRIFIHFFILLTESLNNDAVCLIYFIYFLIDFWKCWQLPMKIMKMTKMMKALMNQVIPCLSHLQLRPLHKESQQLYNTTYKSNLRISSKEMSPKIILIPFKRITYQC